MTQCKTCGRRPSERIGEAFEVVNWDPDIPGSGSSSYMKATAPCSDPLHDLADELVAERSAQTWTETPPTEPGWYWIVFKNNGICEVAMLNGDGKWSLTDCTSYVTHAPFALFSQRLESPAKREAAKRREGKT